jgi:hypothetical protein
VFSDAVSGHRRESPILGERKKRFSSVVRVGFDCPLRAFTGKLAIFERYDHGGVAPLKSPRLAKASLPGRARLFQKAHRSPVFELCPAAVRKSAALVAGRLSVEDG